MTKAVAAIKAVAPPRRGLSRIDAAIYIGVGITKFDELVANGKIPRPRLIGGRHIWDIRALDLAFDELLGEAEEGSWADR